MGHIYLAIRRWTLVIDELAYRADEFLEWRGLPSVKTMALEISDGVINGAIAPRAPCLQGCKSV